ncbi:MAG TPA: hypothetical protein VJZ27_13390, partial [Aggregatilineales bacterium]|nr:hypothetical protein [Aggregatilineales bacterium]
MRKTLNPAQFLLIFAGGLFSILILIGIFNIAFDPYGEYNSGLFWSRVDQAGAIDGRGRSAKLILLNRLDAPPQVLIMGNSRAVALPGDVVEASTGLRTFNTATVNGSVYDLLAFTRYT